MYCYMHVCEFNSTYTVSMKNWDLTVTQRHIQYSDRKYQIIKGILRIPVEEASLIVRDKSLPCLITVIYEKSLWQLSSGIVKISNKFIFWLQVETYPSQWRIIWLSGFTQSQPSDICYGTLLILCSCSSHRNSIHRNAEWLSRHPVW